jgi:hyperosmotically inducible periplasmic protein
MRLFNLCKAHVAVVLMVLILVGCTAMTGRQTAREAASDSAITTKVKSSFLADPVVSATAINVDTVDGAVSLDGVVRSEQERQRAIQLARSTDGVKQVDASNLKLRR